MKIVASFYDTETGTLTSRIETDLRTYLRTLCDHNMTPDEYVVRNEIRDIGAYITQSRGIRCEVTKR